jgi:hypothetical protein
MRIKIATSSAKKGGLLATTPDYDIRGQAVERLDGEKECPISNRKR